MKYNFKGKSGDNSPDSLFMKQNSFIITSYQKELASALSDKISQSEIMMRASCSRKWFYRYVLKLDRRGAVDPNLIYGTVMHFWLEWLYREGHQGTVEKENPSDLIKMEFPPEILLRQEQKEAIDLAIHKAWIAFKAYRWHYKVPDSRLVVMSNEREYEVEIKGHKLVGKIDMVARSTERDGVYIWDFKTAGRLDAVVLDAWSFRFQILYYAWLYWRATGEKPSGTMVNGLVKPGLRPKYIDRKTKTMETRGQFLDRIKDEMQMNREKYFYRQRMPLASGRLEWFEKEMLIPHLTPLDRMKAYLLQPKLPAAVVQLTSDALTMKTNQCHMYNSICEYLPLCKDGQMMLGEYKQRVEKHQELVEEKGVNDGDGD